MHIFFQFSYFAFFTGDKSEVLDIGNPDPEKFPKFYAATRYEGELEPGDILFIPGKMLFESICINCNCQKSTLIVRITLPSVFNIASKCFEDQ